MVLRVQVVSLSGRTIFADVPRGGTTGDLWRSLSEREGIPEELIRLTCAGVELHPEASLHQLNAPVKLLLRLCGGKGGFGAMLRTAGARGVKTTNFDACRDLNGRRLRHVNSEARLREWETQAEARKLKKQQEDARRGRPDPMAVPRFDDDEYEEMLEAARKRVAESFASAEAAKEGVLLAATADDREASPSTESSEASGGPSKKRPAAEDARGAPSKALKLAWDPLAALVEGEGEGETSSEEEEGEEDQKAVA
ncbi:hypothetical protein AB1Y20_000175 [Prymnesium parvum]|uniref:Ubiquitin-like domain-containing protein n=1 Tax=Prymnesium parvum TaxID=97485 RepID=A0AB34K5M6_PRYPA